MLTKDLVSLKHLDLKTKKRGLSSLALPRGFAYHCHGVPGTQGTLTRWPMTNRLISEARVGVWALVGRTQEPSRISTFPGGWCRASRLWRRSLHLSSARGAAVSSEDEGAGSLEVLDPLPTMPLLKATIQQGYFHIYPHRSSNKPTFSKVSSYRWWTFTSILSPDLHNNSAKEGFLLLCFTDEQTRRYVRDPQLLNDQPRAQPFEAVSAFKLSQNCCVSAITKQTPVCISGGWQAT